MTLSLRGTILSKFEDRWVFSNPLSTRTTFAIFGVSWGATQQELNQWKSLEAYNYFDNGQVCTVEI